MPFHPHSPTRQTGDSRLKRHNRTADRSASSDFVVSVCFLAPDQLKRGHSKKKKSTTLHVYNSYHCGQQVILDGKSRQPHVSIRIYGSTALQMKQCPFRDDN